tara:strand:+ start:861 stop:1952 length:1092 start_codon:yes stop_codon:yes gene_type:complete
MKITYLVLIFCLISCSSNPEKEDFVDLEVENSSKIYNDSSEIITQWENQMYQVYESVLPSVVQINTSISGLPGSYGTGFVWDENGYVVTNYHVIQNSDKIKLTFIDLYEYDAEVIAFDIDSDTALLKIIEPSDNLKPIQIGNSDTIRPGQFTLAVGNPFGESFTMTTGIISAVGRAIDSGFTNYKIPDVIQTDAAINPGNSGGPLLNINGEVIGINTQIKSGTRQNSGVGFAVPINLVKKVVTSLIDFKTHNYPYLGISAIDVNKFIRETKNLPINLQGALIIKIEENGPAENYGLIGDSGKNNTLNYDGDIITSIDGLKIKSMNELIRYLALNKIPGDTSTIDIFRANKEETVKVKLGLRPE